MQQTQMKLQTWAQKIQLKLQMYILNACVVNYVDLV